MILGEAEFSYTLRYSVQWDSLQVFYNLYGASLNWDMTDAVRLMVSTDMIRSTAYDSSGVMASLVISLPNSRDIPRPKRR